MGFSSSFTITFLLVWKCLSASRSTFSAHRLRLLVQSTSSLKYAMSKRIYDRVDGGYLLTIAPSEPARSRFASASSKLAENARYGIKF